MAQRLSELERYENAVDAAVEAVEQGDHPAVAADWAVERFDIEHRLYELLHAVKKEVED
jgi:TPP-dependent 2-oxoacid decarboxylase